MLKKHLHQQPEPFKFLTGTQKIRNRTEVKIPYPEANFGFSLHSPFKDIFPKQDFQTPFDNHMFAKLPVRFSEERRHSCEIHSEP